MVLFVIIINSLIKPGSEAKIPRPATVVFGFDKNYFSCLITSLFFRLP